MSEFVKANDILFGEWVALNPISRVFSIPQGFRLWSVHIIPRDSGPAGAPTIDLEYGIDGLFFPINPLSSLTAVNNADNVVTRSDAVDKIRITVTPAIAVPDGASGVPVATTKSVLIRLFATRA